MRGAASATPQFGATGLSGTSAPTAVSANSLPSLPSSVHSQSWLDALLHPGSSTPVQPLVSYPNLYLLQHPATNVAQTVYPSYVAQPAPMGIADYGLGATPYTYSPSDFLGSLTLNAPPNVTDPGAQGVIDPGAQNLGEVGSVYEWGLQLNTILTNVSLPGTNDAVFWTQNVLNINDTGIHFVQDIFNFTTSSFYIPTSGTFLSGCGSTDLTDMLSLYGGVFQCVGGTIPISAADYPLTINLYNNVTITAQNETQLVFGAQISGASGSLSSGPIDTVVFNNPNASVAPPANPVGFTVSGTNTTPVGLLYDSELVLVGSIGGDNAVFRSLNGSLFLGYSNATSGPFTSVPSAYDFGSDTGETATGIAATWSGTTENIDQGPSFLYGLWNAVPWISVPSGSIQFSGSVSPDYGFVFVSNVDPSTVSGLTGTNMSWVPTDASGDFTTYLPPSIPPATQYFVQAFAPEEAVYTGAPFSTAQTSYAITMTSAPGTLNAPIYMQSNAQADALALAVSGSSSPDTFSDLAVNLNFTFNHLNDYGFPSFVIFNAEEVTVPLFVNNLSQGFDSPLGNFYYSDAVAPTGYLTPGAPIIPFSLENYSDQIQVFDSTAATITNETLVGSAFASYGSAQGGSIFLWDDSGAVVQDVSVGAGFSYDFAGVLVGDSTDTVVQNVTVSGGSNGVVDVGSTGSVVSWVNATGAFTFGIYALSSSNGAYSYLNASAGAYGVYAGEYTGYDYYAVPGITHSTVTDVVAYLSDSTGIEMSYSAYVDASNVYAWGAAYGEISQLSDHMGLTGLYTDSIDAGAIFAVDSNDVVGTVSVTGGGFGVAFLSSVDETISDVTVTGGGQGLFDEGGTGDSIVGLTVSGSSYGGEADFAVNEAVSNLVVSGSSMGFVSFESTMTTVAGVTVSGGSTGVESYGSSYDSISGVTATSDSLGAESYYATSTTISDAAASSGSLAVESYETQGDSISHVSATDGSLAVYVTEYASYATVTDVSAANASVGVYLEAQVTFSTVSGVTVTNQSIGVATDYVYLDSISNVVASNTTLGVPLGVLPELDYPLLGYANVAAINSYESSDLTVSGVTATNYPLGLTDEYSGYCYDYLDGYCYGSYSPAPEGLYVSDLNLTGGTAALYLYETANSSFVGIGAYQDYVGVYSDEGIQDSFSQSSFVDSLWFGVVLYDNLDSVVWDNNFIGNNGATSTYSAAHIQGYDSGSIGDTWYLCAPGSGCIGNYWADWHTYLPNGNLAPYQIQGSGWDYYPIGTPVGMFPVSFTESGLPGGTSWSVTFNGVTQSSTASTISFVAAPGEYAFSISGPGGYAASPTDGTATVSSGANEVAIVFQAMYTVTLTETGLPLGTVWSTVFGGISDTSGDTSMTFSVPAGTYAYQVGSVSGYSVSPSSGTVTVAGNYAIAVTYTAIPASTYAVTLSESGLTSGTAWSAAVNGTTQSTSGTSLVFYLPDGSYNYSFGAVAGYTLASGSSGTISVAGAPVSLAGTYQSPTTYAVTLTESGLPAGTTWTATVNGVTESTSGSALVFHLANGTYSYSFAAVTGYTVGGNASGSVTVNGGPAVASTTYSAKSSPSVASSSDLNTYFAVALVIAVIALVIALAALLLRRGGRSGTAAPPESWTPPAGSGTSTEENTAQGTGGPRSR